MSRRSPASRGASVRPSSLVTDVVRSWRSPALRKYRSMTIPAAGRPSDVSSTWVDRRAMLSLEAQSEATVRWAGIGVDAELVSTFGNRIPRAIGRLQVHFRDGRALVEQSGPDPVDQLLNASGRLERCEHVPHDAAGQRHALAVVERRTGIGVAPLEVEPHVQWPIHQVRQRRVLVAHEATKRT